MTDTGGTQTLRHADAAGPIAMPTVGEVWFVLAPFLGEGLLPPYTQDARQKNNA